MTKKWGELKRSVSRWASNVAAVVSSTASILLRRGPSRQVGIVEEAFAQPRLICQLSSKYDGRNESPDKISVDSWTSDLVVTDDDDDFSSVLMLPYDCRAAIYDYVGFREILNLRLTCKQLYYEVNHCRGVKVRLDDTTHGYDWFRHTGVGSLVVRHFRGEDYGLLMRPELLKELTVSGSISPDNFNWLVATCTNIQRLAVEITPYTVRYGLQSFQVDTSMPARLTTLRLSAFMYDHRDAENAAYNIFPILHNVNCPRTLSTFVFHLAIIDSESLDEFHLEALKFIRRHAACLRVLHVAIKQVYLATLPVPELDDPELKVANWADHVRLSELRFTVDRQLSKWTRIVRVQSNLASLELNLRNLRWATLSAVVSRCAHTLKNIQVYNVNVKQGHRICPIDLGILRNCCSLQKLTVHHTEHPPTYSAKISRTAYLPSSLTEMDISRIIVKQHQLLYILIKLPQLRRLEIAYWSDTESYFASLFSLLPLLIKFNLTTLKHVTMTDLRRRFENHKTEINRLKDFLGSLATVKTSDSVRESRVTVEVHQLDDERNFSSLL